MKKFKNEVFIALLFVFNSTLFMDAYAQTSEKPKEEVTITLSGAWALYPMVVRWADEYKKVAPGVRFDISAGGAGKGMTDALSNIVDVGMVSREVQQVEKDKGAFPIAVTKDAVVPTFNETNPFIELVLKAGMKKQAFIDLWITGKPLKWREIYPEIKSSDKAYDMAVNVFTRSDACGAAETWAAYMGQKQENLKGIAVYGDPGLAEAVRKDVFGIGFNNVNYAYDSTTKKQVAGLKMIPIDLNENGKIDPEENFYNNRDSIVQAIAKNIYPSPPARDLYFVTKDKPTKPELIKFIVWTLTEGQKYVPEAGYINLSDEKLQSEISKIK
jgi:phosphate transport system substrate-binding protein